MKFSEEMIEQRTRTMCENPFWREMYENAPERAKERLRIAFWASEALKEKEDLDVYRARREEVERTMTYEDFNYLAENFPEGAGKDHYLEKRDGLQFKSLMTKEKFDEAIDIMISECSEADRAAYEKSREAFKACEDPCVEYEWLWSAVGGNGDDCCMVGDIFDHGHGVEVDPDLAYFWFLKGALSGDGDCCYRLAHLHEDIDGVRFDMARAMFWFREGLRRKSELVKVELGARFTVYESEAWEDRRNPKLGVALLESARVKDKDGLAHFWLGKCYAKGVGVRKNVARARHLFKISADRGCCCAYDALEEL